MSLWPCWRQTCSVPALLSYRRGSVLIICDGANFFFLFFFYRRGGIPQWGSSPVPGGEGVALASVKRAFIEEATAWRKQLRILCVAAEATSSPEDAHGRPCVRNLAFPKNMTRMMPPRLPTHTPLLPRISPAPPPPPPPATRTAFINHRRRAWQAGHGET